jgi:hypothetical protein
MTLFRSSISDTVKKWSLNTDTLRLGEFLYRKDPWKESIRDVWGGNVSYEGGLIEWTVSIIFLPVPLGLIVLDAIVVGVWHVAEVLNVQ